MLGSWKVGKLGGWKVGPDSYRDWMLVVGCWLLVVGPDSYRDWLLVVGEGWELLEILDS